MNRDYYNDYKGNLYQQNKGTIYLTLILKILIIIFLLGVLFVGYLFVIEQTNQHGEVSTLKVEKDIGFQIFEEPVVEANIKSPTVEQKVHIGSTNLTQEEIASVVEMVMFQMNKSSRVQSIIPDDDYTKELLSQGVDGLSDSMQSVDTHRVDSRKEVNPKALLKETNHYNKVVIGKPKEERYSNDRLSQLSNELSTLIDSDLLNKKSSGYTQEITKEVSVRSNEMRVIVVKRGDTLSLIAKRAYGNYKAYRKILKANPEVIRNPNQIFIGQKLRIPL